MSGRPPQARADQARKPIAPPAPADYSDELTEEQIARLRQYAPQDESKMGALVHELTW